MEKKFTLTLDNEFSQYCELNNIKDVNKLGTETFNRGFSLLKYGETPYGQRTKEIVEVPKEIIKEIIEKTGTSVDIEGSKVNIFGKNLVASKKGTETGKIVALLRPETILVKKSSSQGNAKVLTRSFLGASSAIICQTHEGSIVQSLMASLNTGDFHPGTLVDLEVTTNEVLVTNV